MHKMGFKTGQLSSFGLKEKKLAVNTTIIWFLHRADPSTESL